MSEQTAEPLFHIHNFLGFIHYPIFLRNVFHWEKNEILALSIEIFINLFPLCGIEFR